MKLNILAAILLLSAGAAQAADLMDSQVTFCAEQKEITDLVHSKKAEGTSKSDMYKAVASTKAADASVKARMYVIIDAVYLDISANQVFDWCIEGAEERNAKKVKKPATKSGYVTM